MSSWTDPSKRRADLAEFLRTRREALDPTSVGLPPAGRRRTSGLRREEVATLAGVSVSWYTWLEQGRRINPSREVLDALARTLRLDPIEHAHLLALADRTSLRPPGHASFVPDSIRDLLAHLDPAPAYVLGPRWDILAWNAAQERMYPAIATLGEADRNLVWAVFAEPSARDLIGDWEDEARRVLSQFRAETTPIRDDPAVVALIARLHRASPEFAAWWPRHDVAGFEHRMRTFHTPDGVRTYRYQQLLPAGEPDLRIVVHLPAR